MRLQGLQPFPQPVARCLICGGHHQDGQPAGVLAREVLLDQGNDRLGRQGQGFGFGPEFGLKLREPI